MKHVLFLGAGFSRAWGLPVMSEFYQSAIMSQHLSNEEKEFVRKLKQLTRQGASMLGGPEDNLEHMLSFALMAEGFDRSGDPGNPTMLDRLCLILRSIYRRQPDGEFSRGLVDAFRALLRLDEDGQRRNEYVVITTNYDVLVEFVLRAVGLPARLPCKWVPIEHENHPSGGMLYQEKNTRATLCKLHGSLNWHNDPESPDRFRIEAQLWPGHKRADYQSISLPAVCYTDYSTGEAPLIVPPTFFKAASDSRFDSIWKTAGEALRQADQLTFVGYSFPASDTHMNYFLAAHLVHNMDLHRITLIDPDATAVCSRLKASQFGDNFKQMIAPIDRKWEGAQWEPGVVGAV